MSRTILLIAFVALFALGSCTRDNYYRRIPRSWRSRHFICPKNEVWAKCPEAVCAPKTCDDVGYPIPCYDLAPDDVCPSKSRCICREGFVRNYRGICIPMEFCPSCGGDPNAVSGCGNCNKLCSNYKEDVLCTEECYYNSCNCKQGYVLDDITGKCVLPHQCSNRMKCKKRNEIYDPCPSPCPYRTCGINDAAISCAPALPIGHPMCPKPICRCKDGYYRNHLGECVLWKHCPRCKWPNEVYDPCPAPCPPRNCGVNEALILCLVPPKLGDLECKPACRCIDGYLKNHFGICIPKEKCPKCTKPNQVFDPCIAPCPPRRCDVDDRLIKCAAPPKLGDRRCKAGCRCADGYATNSNGDCIPREECPPQCPFNEVYSDCIQGNCSPQKCSQLGFPVLCPRIDTKFCKKGCVCQEGYVRNDDGVCIPIRECPSCGGDKNKIAGCGVYCNQRCSDIGDKPKDCIFVCYENACDCRRGYYLDDNTGLCVLPKQCTPQCPIDEVYSDCIQRNCSPQTCSQLGFPVPCPRIHSKFCTEGCLCKEGYVRNKKGVCIPKSDCPSCGGDRNKIAGCGVYCNQRCKDVGEKPNDLCVAICYDNACDCKEGYYLDEVTGLCVLPKHCSPQCPKNEVYSNCIQGNCSPQKCSELGFPVPCPRIDTKYCKKGCLCIEGYVRNKKGVCIPKTDCPSCGGDRNKIVGCGIYCNQKCTDIGKKPGACIALCYANACDCREGFYLDVNTGYCVLPKHCPPQCPKNEIYSDCIQGNCSPQNCTQLGFPMSCPRIDPKFCRKGCMCIEGYVRNSKGVCIPKHQCPSCGGDRNQRAGCGLYCNQRCRDIGNEPGACIDICIDNTCDCREGYYLDENTGFCVTPNQCSPQCQENEWYSECVQGNCSPEYCTEVGFPIACPFIDAKYCKKGCLCKEGYSRNDQGICIPSKECPSCGGDPNAEPGCGGNCNQRCSDIGKENGVCTLICQLNGCDCKKGYYYNEQTGRCVKPEQCPPPSPQCGINEVYDKCLNAYCGPYTCDDIADPIACAAVMPDYCTEGCRCESGYVKNYKGICVLYSECPSFCPPNEVYSTCVNGGCQARNCSQYGQEIPCVKMDPKYCREGCVCIETYLRADNGLCIPEEHCPGACNGANEEYNECSWNCPPQTCESLDRAYACPIREGDGCKPMCKCKPGFYRNKIGECITEEECRRCTGEHEYFSCGGACDNVCETLDQQSQDNCPIINIKCNERCYCEKDYARAKNNTCIPISCCENDNAVCGKNEIYEDCSNPVCKAKYCTELGFPLDCTSGCRKGCICKDQYVRNSKGICIPIENCPSCGGDPNAMYGCGVNCGNHCSNIGQNQPVACPDICIDNGCDCREGFFYDDCSKKCVKPEECPLCNGENEEYVECSWDCPPQTCESIGRLYECAVQSEDNCKSMCKCKSGFYRNTNGQCVTEEQCNKEKCPGPHEYFACGGACDNVCETLDQQSQDNCPIVNIKCNEMCYCEQGYARAKNNTCIPISCCPDDVPQCPLNERYERCPGANCEPQYCHELGFPSLCTPFDDSKTCPKKPGCVCIDGYVRDENGKCIPKDQCPSCGDDPNARSGCGVNCGQLCTDLTGRITPCKRICYPNSCDCRENFYYDSKQEKCVPASQCTDVCGKDEVFEDCSDPICKAKSCSEVGFPLNCNQTCVKGCVCQNGFVRDDNGCCIPIEHCPSCGGDPNAQPGCGNNCGRRCPNNDINPKFCSKIACLPQLNRCDCREGFYFDINTNCCVKLEDCSPRCDESNNEVYDPCVNGGCQWKNCSQVGSPKICIHPYVCYKGCKCKEDYYRLDNGICVPIYKCPNTKCKGPNEYFSCGTGCDNVCGKLDKESKNNCPLNNEQCVPKCYCEDDYARNDQGICIPKNQCPAGGSTSETTTCNPTSPPVSVTNAIAKFERGNQALAGQFLYYLLQSRPGENFMISGFSILVAMAQLALRANGVVLEQLLRILNLNSKEEVRVAFPVIIENYKEQQDIIITLVVKFYSDDKYPISELFIQESKDIFNSTIESLNFSQAKQAADTINDWVEDNTNGLIKNLVNENMFSPDTRCVIVNALYYLGKWQKQFNKDNTQPRDFYVDKDNTVSRDTMYQKGKFEYAESDTLNCQILKLPYKNGNFSLLIYLPKETFGLQNMIHELKNPDNFANSLNTLSYKDVIVYLPVMDIETNISDLPDLLRKVNITEPFKPDSNGFSGILANEEPLFISDAIQKTKIKVDETGTEAAAATGIVVGTTSVIYPPPEIYTVDCNHPFVFILQLKILPFVLWSLFRTFIR